MRLNAFAFIEVSTTAWLTHHPHRIRKMWVRYEWESLHADSCVHTSVQRLQCIISASCMPAAKRQILMDAIDVKRKEEQREMEQQQQQSLMVVWREDSSCVCVCVCGKKADLVDINIMRYMRTRSVGVQLTDHSFGAGTTHSLSTQVNTGNKQTIAHHQYVHQVSFILRPRSLVLQHSEVRHQVPCCMGYRHLYSSSNIPGDAVGFFWVWPQ